MRLRGLAKSTRKRKQKWMFRATFRHEKMCDLRKEHAVYESRQKDDPHFRVYMKVKRQYETWAPKCERKREKPLK